MVQNRYFRIFDFNLSKKDVDKNSARFLIYIKPSKWIVLYLDFLYSRKVAGYNFFNSFQDPMKDTPMLTGREVIQKLKNGKFYQSQGFDSALDAYYVVGGIMEAERNFNRKTCFSHVFEDITASTMFSQYLRTCEFSFDGLHPTVYTPYVKADIRSRMEQLPEKFQSLKSNKIHIYKGEGLKNLHKYIRHHSMPFVISFRNILAKSRFSPDISLSYTPKGFYRAFELVIK